MSNYDGTIYALDDVLEGYTNPWCCPVKRCMHKNEFNPLIYTGYTKVDDYMIFNYRQDGYLSGQTLPINSNMCIFLITNFVLLGINMFLGLVLNFRFLQI